MKSTPSESNRQVWKYRACCADADTELFFQGRGASRSPALAYCDRCSVMDECLAEAVVQPDLVGVGGGTSPRERMAIRRQENLLPSMPFSDVLAVIQKRHG